MASPGAEGPGPGRYGSGGFRAAGGRGVWLVGSGSGPVGAAPGPAGPGRGLCGSGGLRAAGGLGRGLGLGLLGSLSGHFGGCWMVLG